jgi:predicted nucleic acid-binding protein
MLLDTSAWIEFFNGSNKGKRVKTILNAEKCYTSMVSIAEIVNWSRKEDRNEELLVGKVEELSLIVGIDKSIAMLAGKLNFERKKMNKKWGMADSFILATGSIYGINILSTDRDFEDISSAEILKY